MDEMKIEYDKDYCPPEELMEEWRKWWWEQSPEPTIENKSFYARDEDDRLYFYCGGSRFEVSEHFADNGKTVKELLGDMIRYTAGVSAAAKKPITK